MSIAKMDWCEELIVRTDFGHSSDPDHKTIVAMSCKAEKEGRSCTRRGLCVEARDQKTWSRINSKSFATR